MLLFQGTPFTLLIPDWSLLAQRLFWSFVILLIAWWIARRARASAARALQRTRVDVNLALLISRVAYFSIVGFGAIWVLQIFDVNWAALLAAIGVLGLAISLAIQDVLKNFVAGTYLLAERPFRIGDRIVVKDQNGIVEDVSVRTTTLRCDDGTRVVVPNAVVFSEVLRVNPPPPAEPAGAIEPGEGVRPVEPRS